MRSDPQLIIKKIGMVCIGAFVALVASTSLADDATLGELQAIE